MNTTLWQKAIISPCEQYHLIDGKPLYIKRFEQVMKYHEPGLAPAKDLSGAYHIDIEGNAVYSRRFTRSFGFYEGLAAVEIDGDWFHVNSLGEDIYSDLYSWCGNFQESLCAVKNKEGKYFHIDKQGCKVYLESYVYAGDFKDGVAVICNTKGLHTHIDYNGALLHERWFIDLDIYHKGFARAKDSNGWFHVNRQGQPAYLQRYLNIEPFYNGSARVECFDGELITINQQGTKLTQIRKPQQNPWQQLSDDMVGFWRTEIIATAVQLRLFDYLPGNLSEIASVSKLPQPYLERLLRALWELKLLDLKNGIWKLTAKGELLVTKDQNFLASAAIMWSDVNSDSWCNLPNYIRNGYSQRHPIFKELASDDKIITYHKAIDGYAASDFSFLAAKLNLGSHQRLIGVGRNSKVLLDILLTANPHLQAVLLGEDYDLKYTNIDPNLTERYSLQKHNILQSWPQFADGIFLPRVLHIWQEFEAIKILQFARDALLQNGKIYLLEMLLCREHPNGSLLDLNMLVESGGGLRYLSQWERLFNESKLHLTDNIVVGPCLNLLVLQSK